MRKLVSTLLICTTIMMMPYVGIASTKEEMVIVPNYQFTRSVETDLSIDESGNATCTGRIRVNSTTSSVSATLTLYKKSGSAWVKVVSWNDSLVGATKLTIVKERKVSVGTYKVIVSGTVTAASGAKEVVSGTSGYVTYP